MSQPKNTRSESSHLTHPSNERVFAFGPFEFDADTGLLVGDGGEHSLAPKPAAVLGALLRRSGQLVTKTTLMDQVWEGLAVNEHALADTISVLRQVLRDDARSPTYIQTLHRRGYRFIAPVRTSSTAGLSAPEEVGSPPLAKPARWTGIRLSGLALAAVISITVITALVTSDDPSSGQVHIEPTFRRSDGPFSISSFNRRQAIPIPTSARPEGTVPARECFYLDDPFGTGQPAYASGSRVADVAVGETLRVTLGGVDDQRIVGMSGGWGVRFNVERELPLTLSFGYILTLQSDYEHDEYIDAIVTLNGAPLDGRYRRKIDRLMGNGNGGKAQTTGWQWMTLDLGSVPAGRHTLVLGAFSNKKTYRNEAAEVRYASLRIKDV